MIQDLLMMLLLNVNISDSKNLSIDFRNTLPENISYWLLLLLSSTSYPLVACAVLSLGDLSVAGKRSAKGCPGQIGSMKGIRSPFFSFTLILTFDILSRSSLTVFALNVNRSDLKPPVCSVVPVPSKDEFGLLLLC